MKSNILCLAAGVCVGLAVYHFALRREEDKKDFLMRVSASPWVSYDVEHMEEQQRYIDELLNGLKD